MREYTLSVREPNGSTTLYTSSQLLLQCRQLELDPHYAMRIERLETEGMRYSEEDFDVLNSAYQAINNWTPLYAKIRAALTDHFRVEPGIIGVYVYVVGDRQPDYVRERLCRAQETLARMMLRNEYREAGGYSHLIVRKEDNA